MAKYISEQGIMTQGKYREDAVTEVAYEDPGYLQYLIREDRLDADDLEQAVEALRSAGHDSDAQEAA